MARRKTIVEKLPLADENVTMPEEIEDVIKSVVLEVVMPEDIQLMIDAGIPNKTILTTIVESNGKTYGEFIKTNRDIMGDGFLTLVIAAKQL